MNVSRSGYYKWQKRKGLLNQYQKNRNDLSKLIKGIHDRHLTWGYRRIAAHIRKETGWLISDNLCHKCCKDINVYSKARKTPYKKHKFGNENVKFPNRVKGNWNTTRPLEKVCTDTTIIRNKGKKYDLTMYIDTFNNEILSYDLCNSKNGSDTLSHFRAMRNLLKVIKKRGYKNLETIVHSDQGVVYASRALLNAHRDYNIIRSMSRVGTPTDNPVVESINGWMKNELYVDFNLNQSDDVHTTIKSYINYFNNERLAYSLKYKSPVQYRTELLYK